MNIVFIVIIILCVWYFFFYEPPSEIDTIVNKLNMDFQEGFGIISASTPDTDDIKKFYPSSCCRGINSKDCKRPYLCIIRFILKYHEKELFYSDSTYIIDENNKIRTKKYKIIS